MPPVTLLGGHTLGHVHSGNSGYGAGLNDSDVLRVRAWDATPAQFDNQYYKGLVGVVRVVLKS